jgi:hypothetical protein
MSNVIQFSRPRVAVETIDALIRLGYLRATRRHSAVAVQEAMNRMRDALSREQAHYDSDPTPVA